jgi:3'-5' exoribonuclease
VSAIAQLAEERIVEGTYAVARKRRFRTRNGSSYLALELVDPSGRIEARVWNDVDLLDARFAEGDAVHVLGRVEKFRDRLQLEVRSLKAAPDADPAALTPGLRRDADELDGFLEFLAGEIAHPGLKATVGRLLADDALRASLRSLPAAPDGHHGYAGGLLEHTVGVATICRETAQLYPRLRTDLLLAAALLHDLGRVRELGPAPSFRQTEEGRLLGHVHLGLRLIEDRAAALEADVRSELLHAVAVHHDLRAAKTAEAAALYHANQLDAVAATRPVE